MSKVNFKLNLKGLNEVMKSQELQTLMQSSGEKIRNAAENMSNGGNFETETKTINWIAVTNIRAKDDKAMKAVLDDNVLLKSINAGML